jgi:disulfide bond formation protein DsbB
MVGSRLLARQAAESIVTAPVIYLVMSIALGAVHDRVEVPVEADPATCSMQAQMIAIRWLSAHRPGWRLRSWQCLPGHPT